VARICPFYLGKYSVRQAQWEAVMGNNPSKFKGNPNRPVEYISWYDGQAFMHELNEWEGRGHYCLPTEAQWEYACRAGTQTLDMNRIWPQSPGTGRIVAVRYMRKEGLRGWSKMPVSVRS
jgi:formylglycine-generating enzyme required for sulfatase activity